MSVGKMQGLCRDSRNQLSLLHRPRHLKGTVYRLIWSSGLMFNLEQYGYEAGFLIEGTWVQNQGVAPR